MVDQFFPDTPSRCQVFHIDSGRAIVSLSLLIDIQNSSNNINWHPTKWEADGIFFESIGNKHPKIVQKRIYCAAAYWNAFEDPEIIQCPIMMI
jgi:hypothetical protein